MLKILSCNALRCALLYSLQAAPELIGVGIPVNTGHTLEYLSRISFEGTRKNGASRHFPKLINPSTGDTQFDWHRRKSRIRPYNNESSQGSSSKSPRLRGIDRCCGIFFSNNNCPHPFQSPSPHDSSLRYHSETYP